MRVIVKDILTQGIFSARKAIMQYCQLKKFPNVDIDDIYLGNGVSELIVMSMQGLLDNGMRVSANARLSSGQQRSGLAGEMLFTISVMKLQNGTQILTILSQKLLPTPRQSSLSIQITQLEPFILRELLLEIIEIASSNDLIIFADEIYDRMVMDGMCIRLWRALAPDVFCVSMNGLSKSHRIAGFRVGWMVLSGPKHHVKGYIEGSQYAVQYASLCSNVLAQQVVQTSLGGHQSVDELLLPGGRIYEQRNFIYNAIQDIQVCLRLSRRRVFISSLKLTQYVPHR